MKRLQIKDKVFLCQKNANKLELYYFLYKCCKLSLVKKESKKIIENYSNLKLKFQSLKVSIGVLNNRTR